MESGKIVSIAPLVAFCRTVHCGAALCGSFALLAAFLILLVPQAALAASAADCQQMQNLAQQNMNLYNQHRDPAHLQAARNYENYARQCWASVSGSGGGGGGGGGYSGGGNRFQQGMGALQGILGGLRDMAREQEQREHQGNHRLGTEANNEGIRHTNAGDDEMALAAYERALTYFQANDDGPNVAIVESNIRNARQRLALKSERRRKEEERLASKEESEQGIASLANEYRSSGQSALQQPSAVPLSATSPAGAGSVASPERAPNPFEPQSEASLRPTLPSEEPLNRQMLARPECRQSDDAYWAERAIAGGFNTAEELIVGQQDYDRRRKLGCFAAQSQRPEAPPSNPWGEAR